MREVIETGNVDVGNVIDAKFNEVSDVKGTSTKSRLGQEAWVGAKVSPAGLSRSTVPTRVAQLLESEQESGEFDHLTSCFKIAQAIAKDYNYDLKGEGNRVNAELLPRKSKRGPTTFSEILVWGELVVYTSPTEAESALGDGGGDEQYVRLIQVADNAQLRLMLEPGVEFCSGDAARYVRVDPTGPIYWVRWEERKSKADLDIVCDVPHRGSRETVLRNVPFTADGKGGVKIRYARNKPSSTGSSSQGALVVSTACGRIVGSPGFLRRPSRGVNGTAAEKQDDDDDEDD